MDRFGSLLQLGGMPQTGNRNPVMLPPGMGGGGGGMFPPANGGPMPAPGANSFPGATGGPTFGSGYPQHVGYPPVMGGPIMPGGGGFPHAYPGGNVGGQMPMQWGMGNGGYDLSNLMRIHQLYGGGY